LFGPDVSSGNGKSEEKPEAPKELRPGASGDARPGGSADAASADGLTIEDYAAKYSLTDAEVWRRLRRGELVGRTVRGRLIIFVPPEAGAGQRGFLTHLEALDGATVFAPAPLPASPEAAPSDEGPDLSFLPPLPDLEAPSAGTGRAGAAVGPAGAAAGGFLTLTGERTSAPEMALLLDHLSLAKEENREILRMTQESIRKVTELSDTIVEMKDTVIEAKEAEVLALREQLAARESEIRRLRQQNEDLETLARAMASTPGGD
jgi:hypothetical protein